ncbi:MAG: hypothetical protein LC798_21005 [Chloroflexi bacterium]|nr:hypothetical protein [Chloroflexota bacterium]
MTWIGLWTYVDDKGRGVDDARLVKAAVWPLDDDYTTKKVEADLVMLEKAGKIGRYLHEGQRYFAIVKWREHQRIDKPQKSTLPAAPWEEDSGNGPGTLPPNVRNIPGPMPPKDGGEGKGKEGKGSGRDIAPAPADATKPTLPVDPLWDAMLDACDIHEPPTASARGAYNKARKDLADVGANPSEVHRRADIYRQRWPETSITPSALARHWAECANPPTHVANGVRTNASRQAMDRVFTRAREMGA